MVKAFLEKEMPTATDGEVKNFTDWLNRSLLN
jgi:hypothetical protein